MQLFEFILHIDDKLKIFVADYGIWTYAILFLIVFCETGLVVMPLLPGDSLLFAAGALAATGSLSIVPTVLVLIAAAIIGDAVNYTIGRLLGPKVLCKEDSRIFKRAYLERTQAFYDKYGPMTIVVARFAPIVRTFAPFMAGVGHMSYPRFFAFNVIGGVTWVVLFTLAGYLFGNLPFVEENFTIVVFAIIALSVLPAVWHAVRDRIRPTAAEPQSAPAED